MRGWSSGSKPLSPLAPGETRRTIGVSKKARNYDALGRYTLANTCNQWVGDTLAHAGIAMGHWTPLAGGVMKWVPKPGLDGQSIAASGRDAGTGAHRLVARRRTYHLLHHLHPHRSGSRVRAIITATTCARSGR